MRTWTTQPLRSSRIALLGRRTPIYCSPALSQRAFARLLSWWAGSRDPCTLRDASFPLSRSVKFNTMVFHRENVFTRWIGAVDNLLHARGRIGIGGQVAFLEENPDVLRQHLDGMLTGLHREPLVHPFQNPVRD